MPKLKTHKGASRRFTITGGGKVMRMKVGKSHLRRRKSKDIKRMFDEMFPLKSMDAKRVKRLLPYG
ncbi:MAG: 50S ribosomal protein L35 [Dehalococcoidia bacterium]|nr:50S ribosomal protein L35 [Dehalococcoidia bacterium]